jgi:glycosyltransferase involved in cell wall biosynthesis
VKVSVVVPTYNRAHQIGATLRAVLAQSWRPHEVIVVDDGSTDDTAAVCSEFGSEIHYVCVANSGVSAARNHGARLASGDALAFVDSDDLWHPDKLAIQVAALAAVPDAGWSVTGCDVIDLEGAVIQDRRGFPAVFGVFRASGLEPDAFFRKYFTEVAIPVGTRAHQAFQGDAFAPLFLGNFALPSSAVVRRELFERSGGFDPALRLAEETDFFHRLAALSPVVLLTESLVGYRVGQAGSLISPANTIKLIRNALGTADRVSALRAATPEIDEHRRTGRVMLLRKLAYAELSALNGLAARHAIREAWDSGGAHDPLSLAIYAGSLLPSRLLTVLHRAKRRLRG